MDLLFKRDQTAGKLARVHFKLWGKIELDEEEQALMKRYRLHDAALIGYVEDELARKSFFIGLFIGVLVFALLTELMNDGIAFVLGAAIGIALGYWYLNEHRETVFVKDLLKGRYFSCDSVVELARKEAWLETTVAYLRQVLESAKHWDGTERHAIDPLPKNEARKIILQGI